MNRKANNIMRVALPYEGLNKVSIPKKGDREAIKDLVWISPTTGQFRKSELNGGTPSADYILIHPRDVSPSIHSNLMDAPQWRPEAHDLAFAEEYLTKLFSILAPDQMGLWLGWYIAALQAPLIRDVNNRQFPLLHPNGPAGSGKTQLNLVLAPLHVYQAEFHLEAAGEITAWALHVSLSISGNIAVVFDEYKPRDTANKAKILTLQNAFRLCYNGSTTARGNVDKSTGLEVQRSHLTRPTVFCAEAQETQTAIQDRSISIAMSSANHDKEAFDWLTKKEVERGQKILGSLGKWVIGHAMQSSFAIMNEKMTLIREDFYNRFPLPPGTPNQSRAFDNIAVVAYGLDLAREAISGLLGEASSVVAQVDKMRQTLEPQIIGANFADGVGTRRVVAGPRSELCKVIDAMAFLSTVPEDPNTLVEGVDYFVGDLYVDLKPLHAFVKYQRHCRNIGEAPLFERSEQFVQSLMGYAGLQLPTNPGDSHLLKDTNNRSLVLRLQLSKLETDRVSPFRIST
jgi:hypothetical protein